MKANQESMETMIGSLTSKKNVNQVEIEANQEEMIAKMKAHQEEMKTNIDALLEEAKAC
jgi:hypothetical protein